MESSLLKSDVRWVRDENNPVFPLGEKGSFDSNRCMNPWVVKQGDRYLLYYSGGGEKGNHRICLAVSEENDVYHWKRLGPLFDNGPKGSFDYKWCVLPHVVKIAPDRWHLYYTGNCGEGQGLSSFPGIGLAVSSDGTKWEKHESNSVISRTKKTGDPDCEGIAGGSVIKVTAVDGKPEWRFYYTGCPTVGDDLFLNQQKCVCLAKSDDGIVWKKQGAVMFKRPEVDYENVAVAGPVVHRNGDGEFSMWYSAIGTRWGFYSICYAESEDGIVWNRGENYGDNLQLEPTGDGWEKQMVEYPSIVQKKNGLRMFYCGNGYGSTGIGTAIAEIPNYKIEKTGFAGIGG